MIVTAEPKYTTRIDIRDGGPNANIMFVLSTATQYLKQLGHPRSEIETVARRVMDAKSYAAALNIIREFFPVDVEDDSE